jgi:ribosomal protein L11 methyltransferase
MSYLAVQFDTDAGDAEAWADALLATGALSVDASDPRAGTPEETPLYGEPGEPGVALWPVSRLVALFPEACDVPAALADAAAALGRPAPDVTMRKVAEQDWVRVTQAQFGPIAVAPGFWIVPTWCEVPEPAAFNIRLDPGLAFGTGAHPTTRLCLQWLATIVRPGDSLLDYGCGSGILAIAAARLGARPVVGADIDPQAMLASEENARINQAAATFVLADALPPGTFDIVVANILANPLLLLAPMLAGRVCNGGRIALSGILEPQADAVAAAYAPWFNIAASQRVDGWVLLTGERIAAPLR